MAMGFAFMFFPILLLVGAGGAPNELLDYVQTASFWQARNIEPRAEALIGRLVENPKVEDIAALIKKLGDDDFNTREAATKEIAGKGPGVIPQLKAHLKAKDPEVADRCERLINELSGGDIDPLVLKLMTIRTLGEMKSKEALPALNALLQSKDAFVAEYARRAIALIEGKPYKANAPPASTWDKDLWMLPKDSRIVAQLTVAGTGPLDWAKAIAQVPALGANQANLEETVGQTQPPILEALKKVGNIRIDGVTVGVSGDPGPNAGWVVIIFRGQYNRDRIKATFKEMDADSKFSEKDGVSMISEQSGNATVLLPSDDLFVFIGGGNPQALPVDKMLAALKAGKGTLADDAEMVAVLKTVDTKAGAWAAVKVTDTYRQIDNELGIDLMKHFDTITAVRSSEGNKSHLKVSAKGKDADAIAKLVKDLNARFEPEKAKMKQMGPLIPKTIVDFIGSIQIKSNGGEATITGSMEGGSEALMGLAAWPMMMMRGGF